MNWIDALSSLSRKNRSLVIVTVLLVEGSAPRDSRTKMVVDIEDIHDTIGGGKLEFEVIREARSLIKAAVPETLTKTYSLGQDLSQCCGGRVTVLFECIPANNFNVILFGAGHVGTALATIISQLPCRLTWIDSRELIITRLMEESRFNGVDFQVMENPTLEVENCPKNAYHLVMTHSHEIDMELVEAILSRKDARFCGLIGSRSKSVKFRNRLIRKGFSKVELSTLTSPVGISDLGGKSPMEIAVSVAAQLMKLHQESMNPVDKEAGGKSKTESTGGDIRDNVIAIGSDLRE